MTTIDASHDLGPLAQIPVGEGRNFLVGETRVAVFHTQGGEVFATQPDCPHRRGPLADGLIGGTTVVCPLHERVYDLRDGSGIGTDCALTTYAASISNEGTILLCLR